VIEKLFRDWNIELLADRWLWLKVTAKGEPVFDLSNPTRRCYESASFAWNNEVLRLDAALIIGQWGPSSGSQSVPRQKLFASVPLGHSRKPSIVGEHAKLQVMLLDSF
jgi:hypothetical protein